MTTPQIVRGWLLSREYRPGSGGAELVYWLSTDSGPRCLVVPDQPYLGIIRQSEQAQWESWLGRRSGWRIAPTDARDFSLNPVSALYLSDQRLWQSVKSEAKNRGWTLLESDIRPCDRYLMERYLCGALEAKVSDNQMVAARPAHPEHAPSLVSLDIECSRHGELYSVGLYGQDTRRVLMVGPDQGGPEYLQYVADEAELLRALLHWFEQDDPDVIIGWSVIGFDLALLHKRAQHHGIKFSLGRDGSEPRWHEQAGPGRDCAIAGRAVLDGIEWLKAAFYHFDSYALDAVAQSLLGEGKACDDVKGRLAEIEHNFRHDKPALAHYNLKDCELVWRIFEKTQLLPFALARSQMTGLELDRTGGSVAAFTHRYLPLLHRAGFVAPNLDTHSIPPSPGGYVMDSIPGKYRNVLVLDFKSLYPSIIRSFLIDPMGMVTGMAETDPTQVVEGFRGAMFHRTHHRLPAIIAELAQQRETAKREGNAPLSQAIKILMNSFYGVLGAAGCRFHDPRLASSITLRGHEIMKTTRSWIESEGYRVIYGDTDSTFVHIGDHRDSEEAERIGKALVAMVNRRWHEQLAEQGLDSALELEFETHFHHFFMPTIRGSSEGSKKRYVGAVEGPEGLDLTFKGMETVRSDWTPLARAFQKELYLSWFQGKPVTGLIRRWIEETRSGERDSELIYSKRLRRDLDGYQANAPHVQAARLANQLQSDKVYRKGSRIRYFIGQGGPFPAGLGQSAIDYEHYVEKQLKPVAEPVLTLLGRTFAELDGDQLGLF
ncbi:DNA polymerase II [Ferrimonas balearica]|uniref:DNA polymerase II n=1 Tax=Ferrimonas balearica TaxID=44012 RepID=UPI001C9918EB|nr:DNA polymerase II [Ferrimonas balearica]MBY5921160.1 DNA polymerase II [Ferrimonas balearica]MBY5996155.1 DNA polymerase II [Ferrimonas balearica]